MALQGKCEPCRIRYEWASPDVALRTVRCMECGGPLKRTQYRSSFSRRIVSLSQICNTEALSIPPAIGSDD